MKTETVFRPADDFPFDPATASPMQLLGAIFALVDFERLMAHRFRVDRRLSDMYLSQYTRFPAAYLPKVQEQHTIHSQKLSKMGVLQFVDLVRSFISAMPDDIPRMTRGAQAAHIFTAYNKVVMHLDHAYQAYTQARDDEDIEQEPEISAFDESLDMSEGAGEAPAA